MRSPPSTRWLPPSGAPTCPAEPRAVSSRRQTTRSVARRPERTGLCGRTGPLGSRIRPPSPPSPPSGPSRRCRPSGRCRFRRPPFRGGRRPATPARLDAESVHRAAAIRIAHPDHPNLPLPAAAMCQANCAGVSRAEFRETVRTRNSTVLPGRHCPYPRQVLVLSRCLPVCGYCRGVGQFGAAGMETATWRCLPGMAWPGHDWNPGHLR